MIATKNKFFISILLAQGVFMTQPIAKGDDQSSLQQDQLLLEHSAGAQTKKKKKNHSRDDEQKTVSFKYENENLVDIINALAEQKKVNVIMSSKESDKVQGKVTIDVQEKVTLDEAWQLLATILDSAGFSMIKEGDWYEIIKNTKTIGTEPLPLYIGVNPDKLPNADFRIRYIYYLTNLKIAGGPTGNPNSDQNEIYSILTKLLPENKEKPPVFLDVATNSIIISEKANSIRSAMKVIEYLDKIELQEKLEIIKLRYLSAQVVADIFNKNIQARDPNRYTLDLRAPEATYFSQNVRIMPYDRMNAVLALGKRQDIERIKDFIYKYLDVPIDSGQSILHVYQLQYLDAFSFAQTLKTIVTQQAKTQSAGQTAPTSGIDRYFDEVKIMADIGKEIKAPSSLGQEAVATNQGEYSGGNKLIIACTNDDWKRIKELIEELDIPQPQVIIEVLIADLTATQTRNLASMLRNPACLPLPNTLNAQSAQIAGIITDPNPSGTIPPPSSTQSLSIASDLMNQTGVTSGTTTNYGTIASSAVPGTAMISYNDTNGRTWGIQQVLDSLNITNTLTNPHVIATNNTPTKILSEDQRLVPDAPVNINSGATTITRKWIKAPITVQVTPRISSAELVNLNLDISINNFQSASFTLADANSGENLAINTRVVRTNSNVRSGDILVLGGLSRIDDTNGLTKTPILGDIPFLGYFFKNRNKAEAKTTLTIFICPTIIQPRLRAGIGTYTTDYVTIGKAFAKEGVLFDSLRDPITRWFFRDIETDPAATIDAFVAQDEIRRQEEMLPIDVTPRESNSREKIRDSLNPALTTPIIEQRLSKNETGPTPPTSTLLAQAPIIEEPKKDMIVAQAEQKSVDNPESRLDMLAEQIKNLYKDLPTPQART